MTLSFCWQTKTWFAGTSTSETPLFLAGEADVHYKPACWPYESISYSHIKTYVERGAGCAQRFGQFYASGSWDQARRVVAKVEWHAGELFPRVGFLVTNRKWRSQRVARFYNARGAAEQWIKEGKNAVKWTKLSCLRFKGNETRLQLFALAYNLANFLRQLVLPKPIQGWTLTTLREKLVKIGAKVVSHAKYVVFQLAEVAVPRPVFAAIVKRIGRLRLSCASG